MPGYRKLGRTSTQRKAMLRNLATNLLYHGKIVTTETRAKEVRGIVEKLITLSVKERDNYTEVTVMSKVAKKDKNGNRIKSEVNGKRVTEYENVEKKIKKDNPSRLNARHQILAVLYPVTEVPADGKMKKKNTKSIDMPKLLFEEIAPKYADRNGGYTRSVKIGPRKGDAAEMVVIELI